jgi:6,7-dimethyl-8-ribityllumazine synthase
VVHTYGDGQPDARGLRVAIVVAMFNDQITRKMRDGAIQTAIEMGVAEDDIEVYWVPGAFELALVAQRLAETSDYDAIAALGAIIRGDTPHFDFVATQTGRGIMDVTREYGLPVAFGVITTDNLAQAEARAGGEVGNKGSEAMYACLHVAALLRVIDEREATAEA